MIRGVSFFSLSAYYVAIRVEGIQIGIRIGIQGFRMEII